MSTEPEAYSVCRFYVMFDESVQGVFTEVSGLQIETDVMEYQEGGNNSFVHRLPGFTKFSNITLKRGMTKSGDFFKWCTSIANGQLIRRNVSIIVYDTAGEELIHWDFHNAYPVKWIGPQFRAADSTAAIETLELAHEGIKLG
jgi:phage tail-like protein